MVQRSIFSVKSQQERSHLRFAVEIAKAPDNAIGGALPLDFLHTSSFAGLVREVYALGNYAVETRVTLKPPFCKLQVICCGRESKIGTAAQESTCKGHKPLSPYS